MTAGSLVLLGAGSIFAERPDPPKLENPFDVDYIETQLAAGKPRLIYNQAVLDQLTASLESDPVVRNYYQAIRRDAYEILELPLIERNKTSNAMLHVSREFLRRMNFMGLVYLIERDELVLERIEQELLAISEFKDWNPRVYLDTAEISMGVALALDWTLGDLPASTITTTKRALINKGILPSWETSGAEANWAWWVDHYNNWNQVCNGGMIAASVAISDKDPELAAKTIRRAMDGLPNVLAENYAPDGACPEGVMYWQYTTSYALLTLSILETSFGSDFGYRDFPGFMRSADFKVMCSNLPTGGFYDFADCRDGRGDGGDMLLAWFAAETGQAIYYEKEKFMIPVSEIRPSYLAGAYLSWMGRYQETCDAPPPNNYVGLGRSPVAVFRDHGDPNGFYLGAKGGAGAVSHGHMDAGSFIFELDGVRWSIEQGAPNYMIGEQGFNLWRQHQESERWELLALNNHGHSTLTIDDQRHVVDGYATVSDYDLGESPTVTFDLSPTFGGQLASASRSFTRTGPRSVAVNDRLHPLESTQQITWQMMTLAEVEPTPAGAILRQDGETLELIQHTHPDSRLHVVSLDPPPHRHDKRFEGLKRLELRIPVEAATEEIKIHIELRGQ